jgi:TolB-like protein/Tfp pilus assembly protein PilF
VQNERRLAAIMFTDMVGYTALGQRNESLSLALVEEQRKVVRAILARHNGREVKTIGDAFLVEFPNAVDAVRCAYDIQRAIRELNLSLASDKRILLRIGIHVGDIVVTEGDISGDAVNVASRIEPLAEDGGVCVTSHVYDFVRGKVDLSLTSIGPKNLKNVSAPVEVYKMVRPWGEEQRHTAARFDSKRVAVLPFANMSPDPNDEYFADGLTEELIDRLSQIKELEVIARTSVMSFKKKEVKAGDIGRELRAGALVEGSVRKAGNKIRVTAQLINANTESHLWSSKYDRDLEDVFAVQTDIAEQVARALKIQLLPAELNAIGQRRTDNMEAYTLYLKGRQAWNGRSRENLEVAKRHFSRAIEIDPSFAPAYVGLADCYGVEENWGYSPGSETVEKEMQLVREALGIDPDLAEARTTYAMYLAMHEWRWQEAEQEFKKAIDLNSSYATAHQWYSYSVLRAARRVEEEMREARRAIELDPLAPVMHLNMGQSLFYQERYDEAILSFKEAIQVDPGFIWSYLFQAACLLLSGRQPEAIRLYEEYLPRAGYSSAQQKLTWAAAYANTGRETEARKLLAEVESAHHKSVGPLDYAEVHMHLGEPQVALQFLESAAAIRTPFLAFALIHPSMKPLRSNPRFLELKRKVGT